jgi:glycerophosphoryl diester phosphodiesterase
MADMKRAVDLFGHRGAAGEAPENTLAGIQYAFGLGVRCLEFDVHLTADGELAVIHDEALDRTTDGKGHVGGYTMAELRELDAGKLFPGFAGAKIPSLSDVLDEWGQSMRRFQLEIKPDRPFILDMVCRKVADEIASRSLGDKIVVTSFDPYVLRRIAKLLPSQNRGLICMTYRESDVRLAESLGCFNTCIPLRMGGSKALVDLAHSFGLEVTGWLGNSIQDIDELLDWGVDSITTNYPSTALPYLQAKGLSADRPGGKA